MSTHQTFLVYTPYTHTAQIAKSKENKDIIPSQMRIVTEEKNIASTFDATLFALSQGYSLVSSKWVQRLDNLEATYSTEINRTLKDARAVNALQRKIYVASR